MTLHDTVIIRPLRQDDIPACLAIAVDGWGKFAAQVGQPDFGDMFSSAAWRPFFYVAEHSDGLVVGMAGYGPSWLTYGIYNLFWVGVRNAYERRGIGSALVQRCLDDLTPIADVVMLMTGKPEFYTSRWPFKPLALLPNAEGYGEHLLILKSD